MSDVFISYSRKDTQFIREILELLAANKREAWIDLHDIDYSVKWWEEICAGIDGADNFVLFVSQSSLESLFVHREIEYALSHQKRIIPFLIKRVDEEAMFEAWRSSPDLSKYEQMTRANWKSIQDIQWIDYTLLNDASLAVETLLATVDTDPQRVKLHTRLLLRLRDWESQGQNPSGLLRGEELAQYEQWRTDTHQKGTPPHATEEQEAYIAESRRYEDAEEAKRLQRERLVRRFRIASVFLAGFLILAVVATIVTIGYANNAVSAQQTSVAKEAQAVTQVAQAGVTLQAGSTLIASGITEIAINGQTLTPIPPQLTAVAQTLVAGGSMIESLKLSASANSILRSAGGNAETAALLGIRVLRKIYLPNADGALVDATNRLMALPQEFKSNDFGYNVAFSPDGKTFLLATHGGNAPIELRNTASSTVIWTINPGGSSGFTDVVFSPDGKMIAAAGNDHSTLLLDAATGKTVHVLTGHSDVVARAVFSPDSKTVLTIGSGNDLTARLWDAATGSQIFSTPTTGGFDSIFFFQDGQTFYARGNVYSSADGHQLPQGSVGGGSLAVSPDGTTYIAGLHPIVELRDIASGQVIRSFTGHTDSVDSAAFSSDGTKLVTGSRDNTARVWDVASGKLLMTLSGHSAPVESVAFSPDGTLVLTGSSTARLWNLISGKQQITISVPRGITASALSPDGKTILAGDVNGGTALWDLNTGQLLQTFTKDGPDIKSVDFSPDGKMVAVPGYDPANAIVQLFDPANGKLLKTFTTPSNEPFVQRLAFSADSKMIFAAVNDGTAQLWDVESGQLLRAFKNSPSANHAQISFSADAKAVVLDGGKSWLEPASGATVNFPDIPNNGGPLGIVFSADGSLFAVADSVTAAVWDVAKQRPVNHFSGHNDRITSMAISPDNRLLLTGSADKTARLWEIASGRLLRVYSGHTSAVTSVAFMPDGKKIVTGSLDMTIRTWITDYNDMIAYACSRVGLDLSPEDRTYYEVSDQEPTCPQFGSQSSALLPTTTPMPTRTPLPRWTPIMTPTPDKSKP